MKRKSLGRGIGSLISMDDIQTEGSSAINQIAINNISPNPEQPRQTFDEEALEELAASIRELGIIQPLTLRSTGDGNYQIISGERRYRAAVLAGLQSVPAYIRTANDSEMTEMALIENIQREDLNAIDMGHARAMLSLDEPKLQLKLYNETIKKGLSVRQVEQRAKQMQQDAGNANKGQQEETKRLKTKDLEIMQNHLASAFGVPVKFTCDRAGKGKITFPFTTEDELKRIIRIFDNLKNA